MPTDFDPYYEWLGIPPKDQPPHAYRLLGLELFEDNPKVIETAAEQRMLLLRTRQSGQHGAASQKLLNEISQAQRVLLNPNLRHEYDAKLRERLAPALQTLRTAEPIMPLAMVPAVMLPTIASPTLRIVTPTRVRPQTTPWIMIAAVATVGLLLLGGVVVLIGSVANKQKVVPEVAATQTLRESGDHRPPPLAVIPTAKLAPAAATESLRPLPDKPISATTPPVVNYEPVVSELPQPPAEMVRLPLPEEALRTAAVAKLQDALSAEFDAFRHGDGRPAFLEKLSKLAAESTDRPAEHAAVLGELRKLAMEAGEWWIALRAVERTDQYFITDRFAQIADTFTQSIEHLPDRGERLHVFRKLLEFADDALEQEQLVTVAALLKEVDKPLRALNDPLIAQKADQLRARGAERYPFYKAAQESLRRVAAGTADGKAKREAGAYRCFVREAWPAGLPLLSGGDDEPLADLASRDLALPTEAAAQFKLASDWWAYAEGQEPLKKANIELRAGQWLRESLAKLAGSDRKLAESRVETLLTRGLVERASPLEEKVSAINETMYLDDLSEDFSAIPIGIPGRHGATGVRVDYGPQELLWHGKQLQHALFFHPISNGTSFMMYRLGLAYRRFRGTVGIAQTTADTEPAPAPATFRILGDGRVLWESKPVQERGQGQDFDVDISQVITLRIESSSPGSFTGMHTLWINPQLYSPVTSLATVDQRWVRSANTTYLDDLIEANRQIGWGRLTRFGSTGHWINEHPILMQHHAERALRCMVMVPVPDSNSYAEFTLDGRYDKFEAHGGVTRENDSDQSVSPLIFRVVGDGKVLWSSSEITRANHFEGCSVSISGVQRLRLQVDCAGDQRGAWAGWYNARLQGKVDPVEKGELPLVHADQIVVWNTHNGAFRDQGARRLNLLLFRGSKLVWQRSGIELPWDGGDDQNTSIPIPRVAFNRVRAEVIDQAGEAGAGLSEIEVFDGKNNIAREAVATATLTWLEQSPIEHLGASTINDGVTNSNQQAFGYLVFDRRTNGWVELEWQSTQKSIHPALKYALKSHPTTAVSFNKHSYAYFPGAASWLEAQQKCQAMGGYLACIQNAKENEFVNQLKGDRFAWIGLRRQSGDQFAWLDGSPLNYTTWLAGEPNNADAGESAVEMRSNAEWNDTPDWSPNNQGFVCEWEN